jgi:hypothetical protein
VKTNEHEAVVMARLPNAKVFNTNIAGQEKFRVEAGGNPLGAWKDSREEAWESARDKIQEMAR